MMSAQGQSVKDITSLMQVSEDYVRDVIHAFNERGFDALDPKWSGGRPKAISERVREGICLVARTSPADWGIAAFSTWSLAKLAEHLVQRKVVPAISRETLRRILREGQVSWQATTTWKASSDPDFIAKMHRVLELYDAPPADGRVICVDEFGPLNLLPRKGKAWRPHGKPRRMRATYHRYDGVMHMIAALDLATGEIYYRIRRRKRWQEFLGLLKALRARWPGEAARRARRLLPAQAPQRPRLGCGQPGRAGLPAHLRIVAQLDRIRVRGPALLRPQRHRPPQPRRTERRHRRLHPLAQRPRRPEDQLRPRLTDPHLDRLPGQGCVTSH